ncbi:collagen alpha-1(I) chain-like [Homarus americanus]|uniref:collagen alpha-1(I) chain-like n=1 Tax=Homarus americanus TaxID=6706 RepID=UPI001C45F920|nr:collagen alpha-1(I) chain-like [Homarus americanus]
MGLPGSLRELQGCPQGAYQGFIVLPRPGDPRNARARAPLGVPGPWALWSTRAKGPHWTTMGLPAGPKGPYLGQGPQGPTRMPLRGHAKARGIRGPRGPYHGEGDYQDPRGALSEPGAPWDYHGAPGY